MTRASKAPQIHLNEIHLTNYKAFDKFGIKFPERILPSDVDVFVVGSKNGIGKTSLLEASALCTAAAFARGQNISPQYFSELPIDIYDLLIHAGKDTCQLRGALQIDNSVGEVEITLKKNEGLHIRRSGALERQFRAGPQSLFPEEEDDYGYRFLAVLSGLSNDPLAMTRVMYFHSYRRVQEGNPELRMMVEPRPMRRRWYRDAPGQPISSFKITILRLLMGRAQLFESIDEEAVEGSLDLLNSLTERYAGGRIERLKPTRENTIDFRIKLSGGKGSFTFDGLSSGQKEIISTLFLIWYHSRHGNNLVLIDEPESHLNAEWQTDFVTQLMRMGPQNQYVLATHSSDIYSSVENSRRAILRG